MSFYAWMISISILLMIAMILHVAHHSVFTREQKTWFILTFAVIIVCASLEYVVHSGHVSIQNMEVLAWLTVCQFALAPLLAVMFTGALGLHQQGKVAILFFLGSLLFEVIAKHFNAVFFFDAEGYHRGRLFVIYELIYLASLVYLTCCMFIVGQRFQHRDRLTIIMIFFILVAGIVPMSMYQLNVTYLAIAISASLAYIYYNDLIQEDVEIELRESQKQLSVMQNNIIAGLANIIESRDMETGAHISRTSALVKDIAQCAKEDNVYNDELNDHFMSLLYILAPMHDVGKILVPDNILKKPGRLTPEEFEEIKRHASEGGHVIRDILATIADEEYIKFASDIAMYHHERWDGTGYPAHLKGDEIPLAARIMAIADVYDALISDRCYKKAMPKEEAIEIIRQESGTHFDPNLVEVFLRHHAHAENLPDGDEVA